MIEQVHKPNTDRTDSFITSIATTIAGEMSEDLINSHELGSFLYGTGISSEEPFRNTYAANIINNETLKQKQEEIAELLSSNAVPYMSLKGVDQIQELYGDLGMRPTSDIDILVNKADRQRCETLLAQLGFSVDATELSTHDRLKSQITLTSKKILVDLHWDLVESERYKNTIRADINDLWEHTSADSGLSPEMKLLFLTFHISVPHFFSRAYWLIDIALLLNKYGKSMDWDLVASVSKKWRIGQALLLSLGLCERLFGISVSQSKRKLPKMKPGTAYVLRYLSKAILTAEPQAIESKKYAFGLLIRDSAGDVLRVLLDAILPPSDWIKEKYNIRNKLLVVLYRIFHPLNSLIVGISNILNPTRPKLK